MAERAQALPFLLLLVILPFPGTVALRLVCLAFAFVIALAQWRARSAPAVPCVSVMLAWATVALLSVAFAVDPGYSLGEVKNEVGYAMMAFIAFLAFARDERDVSLASAAIILSAVALCLWIGLRSALAGAWLESAGHGGKGDFATYAVTVLPLLLLAVFRCKPPMRRAAGVAIVLMLATAFYSGQRSIWPVFALQACVMLWLLRGRSLALAPRHAVLASIAVIALAATALLNTQSLRHQDAGPAVELASDSRFDKWLAVGARIAEHPLIGAGFGRQAMAKGHPDLVSERGQLWHAHNTWLNYGLAMGVPGMLALLAVFLCLAREYWALLRSADALLQWLGAAGLALLLGVFLRNQVNDSFVRHLALLFWALNGMLLGAGLRRAARSRVRA